MQKTHYSQGPNYFGTTAKKSWFDEGDRCAPGPGAHQIKRFHKTNLPIWTIGKDSERNTFLQKHHTQYPSPDRYKVVENDVNHPKQPCHSIPLYQPRQNPNKIDEGNSLDYHPKYNALKQKHPNYSFGYYFERDYTSGVPPSNNYNPSIIDKKSFNTTQRSFSIGQRPPPYGQEGRYPYVGKYNVGGDMSGSKFSICDGNRLDYTVGASPGQFYQISGDIKHMAHGKTMGLLIEVPRNKDQQDFPSPDKYNPLLSSTTRNIINYRGNRSQIRDLALDINPSPNKYEINDLPTSQTVSFTKQRRESPDRSFSPGVGTYNVESKPQKTLGGMAIKLKKLTQFVVPSPSAYQPKEVLTRPNNQKSINLYSDRTDFSKSITGNVGPGVYEVRTKQQLSLGKIGKGYKFEPNKNFNPGPGSYQIPTGIGKLPKYCSGPKKLTTTGFSFIEMQKQEKRLQRQKKRAKVVAQHPEQQAEQPAHESVQMLASSVSAKTNQ